MEPPSLLPAFSASVLVGLSQGARVDASGDEFSTVRRSLATAASLLRAHRHYQWHPNEDDDMPYVQLEDVNAYYEEDGDGEPLVLLHPGLADSRAFEEYLPALAERFRVFRPDRRGHGRTADVDGPITYDVMAVETIAFLERVVREPAHLLGHSDGAPVALLAALSRPDLVRRLVFSAGVFHYDGWTPGATELDDETVAFFRDYWGAVAPQGHGHFEVVKTKLDRMHREEPTLTEADLAGYPGPALVMVGDRDEEIHPSHTLALFKGLPDGRLAVLPGTGHGGVDTRIVIDFLTEPRDGTSR